MLEFLGVMSRVEMLATWFVHDSGEHPFDWRLKGHVAGESVLGMGCFVGNGRLASRRTWDSIRPDTTCRR